MLDFVGKNRKTQKKLQGKFTRDSMHTANILKQSEQGVRKWEQKQNAVAVAAAQSPLSFHNHIVGGDLITVFSILLKQRLKGLVSCQKIVVGSVTLTLEALSTTKLLRKNKRQYIFTCKVSSYCL